MPLSDKELEDEREWLNRGVSITPIRQKRLFATVDALGSALVAAKSSRDEWYGEYEALKAENKALKGKLGDAAENECDAQRDLNEALDELLQSYYTARHCHEDDALMISWRERIEDMEPILRKHGRLPGGIVRHECENGMVVESQKITAPAHPLRRKWSIEAADDMKNVMGADLEVIEPQKGTEMKLILKTEDGRQAVLNVKPTNIKDDGQYMTLHVDLGMNYTAKAIEVGAFVGLWSERMRND